jgi:hypothetical protein
MIEKRHLAAFAGFAFVAAWIGFGFGDALLCLLGAAVAWVAFGILEGKVDLGELQSRLSGGDDDAPPAPGAVPPAPGAAPPPPPAPQPVRRPGRPRVQ